LFTAGSNRSSVETSEERNGAGRKPSRRVLRRLEQIEALPSPQQSVLLKTIDTFLENAAFRAARR